MADNDRGAYTPQTDAPLAFDPRRPSERRPMPMALIGSGVVLVMLLAAVAMVYRSGVRHAGEAPRPVGEPVMSVKTAPAPEAAAPRAPPTLDVYNAGGATASNAAAAEPVFAPAAEEPAARPAPKASTLAMMAKPQAAPVRRPTPAQSEAAKTAEDAQVQPVAAGRPHPAATAARSLDDAELAAAGMTRTRASNAAARSADTGDEPRPALRKAAPATAAAPAPDAPTGPVVQIGAFSSDTLAEKGYAAVSAAMAGQMNGKSRHVQPLQHDGKTLFRTWVAGFASHADARAFCDALKSKGQICIVKG